MIDSNYCYLMAQYNQWMNHRVYEALGNLPREDLKIDHGLFFGSIQRTLNHIIHRDIRWIGWFGVTFEEPERPAEELFEDFGELRIAREKVDVEILTWAEGVSDEFLRGALKRPGRPNSDVALWVLQMFNHQTHHRSQVLTALFHQGIDIGATDLPAMPRVGSS